MVDALPHVIEAHLRIHGSAVERVVFGLDDPSTIARELDAWSRRHLGAAIRGAEFYRSSSGCVTGVNLSDGRAVVLKATSGRRPRAYLDAVHRARRHLHNSGLPCTIPLSEPQALGSAWVVAEPRLDVGVAADPHQPAARAAIAAGLADLIEHARGCPDPEPLGRPWFSGLPEGRVFPRPHSPRFDFTATSAGAEWIDALAQEARTRRDEAQGQLSVGHFDWRVEHLRLDGQGVCAVYDWDSLHVALDTVAVGAAAPHFTCDWGRDDVPRVPTIETMRAFVSDYERARKLPFTRAERRTIAAAAVYGMAYSARCNHAARPDHDGDDGDLRPLLARHGPTLLRDGL